MNNAVYFDSWASDEVRRQHLYDGQLFVYAWHDRRRFR